MGRKLTPGLEWLEPNDPEQLRWAATYLATRGLLETHEHPKNRSFGEQVTYEDLVRIGRRLLDKKRLIKNMRDAWYQKKSCARESSRKTYSFTLRPETKIKLTELAGGGSASATLEILIDKAYKAKLRKDQKLDKKPQITLQEERNHTLVDMYKIMTDEEPSIGELEASIKENPESDLGKNHSQQPTENTADSIEKPTIKPPEEKAEIQTNKYITTKEESKIISQNQNNDDYEKDLATREHQTKKETPEHSEGNQENNKLANKIDKQPPKPNLITRKKKSFTIPNSAISRAPKTD